MGTANCVFLLVSVAVIIYVFISELFMTSISLSDQETLLSAGLHMSITQAQPAAASWLQEA